MGVRFVLVILSWVLASPFLAVAECESVFIKPYLPRVFRESNNPTNRGQPLPLSRESQKSGPGLLKFKPEAAEIDVSLAREIYRIVFSAQTELVTFDNMPKGRARDVTELLVTELFRKLNDTALRYERGRLKPELVGWTTQNVSKPWHVDGRYHASLLNIKLPKDIARKYVATQYRDIFGNSYQAEPHHWILNSGYTRYVMSPSVATFPRGHRSHPGDSPRLALIVFSALDHRELVAKEREISLYQQGVRERNIRNPVPDTVIDHPTIRELIQMASEEEPRVLPWWKRFGHDR